MTEAESVQVTADAIRDALRKGRERLGEHARYEDGLLDGYTMMAVSGAEYMKTLKLGGYDEATISATALLFKTVVLAIAEISDLSLDVQP